MTSSRREFLMRAGAAGATVAASTNILATPAENSGEHSGQDLAACRSTPTPMKDVAGKVAFITGGSSGIGLGIARAFVEAGMKVAIGYRSQRNLDEAMQILSGAEDRVHAINVDVNDRTGMKAAADEVVRVFGKVHVLVNNAGVVVSKPVSQTTYEDWDWLIGTNLTGVFNGVRAFLPHFRANKEGGQVVTTSSVMGLFTAPFQGPYSASKFAVVGLMEALRLELQVEDSNVGVSVFCPGNVWSRLTDGRHRPGNPPSEDPSRIADQAREKKFRAEHPDWEMDPFEAGRLMLRGMRNNDLYILTHPEFKNLIRERSDAIDASSPTDLIAPKDRLRHVDLSYKSSVYAQERDRKKCRPYTSGR